jgi:hypothetical protein
VAATSTPPKDTKTGSATALRGPFAPLSPPAAPAAFAGVTAPSPVSNSTRFSPAAAGAAADTHEYPPARNRIGSPLPSIVRVKMRGARGASVTAAAALVPPAFRTRSCVAFRNGSCTSTWLSETK